MSNHDAEAEARKEIELAVDRVMEKLPQYAVQVVRLSDVLDIVAYSSLRNLLLTGVVSNISRPYFVIGKTTLTPRVGFEVVSKLHLEIWEKVYEVGSEVTDRLRKENNCEEVKDETTRH